MCSEFSKNMSQIWEDYLKRMSRENGDYLIQDGIDPDKTHQYFSQAVKVLFVLKESNEKGVPKNERKDKSIFDNNGWFTRYGSGDRAMITKMIKMYRFICDIEKGIDTQTGSKKAEAEDRYNFAFININKHGNGEQTANEKKIKNCINTEGNLLADQINLLNPDVIVFGVKAHEKEFKTDVIDKLNNKGVKLIVTPHFKRMGYAVFEEEVRRKYGLTE